MKPSGLGAKPAFAVASKKPSAFAAKPTFGGMSRPKESTIMNDDDIESELNQIEQKNA